MALGNRRDPLLSYRFLVEIEGLIVGGFSDVTGLQAEIETQDLREGGLNGYVHKLPGPLRYPANLVLRRGMTGSATLWNWFRDAAQGRIMRRNGSIVLLDATGDEKWRWNFVGAYPVRWVGPELQAASSNVAIETIELVHRGLQRMG